MFRVLPPEDSTASLANQRVVELTVKCFKVVAYLLTFIIVLSAGVISKGTVLFMTSQLRQPLRTQEYCSRSKLAVVHSFNDFQTWRQVSASFVEIAMTFLPENANPLLHSIVKF